MFRRDVRNLAPTNPQNPTYTREFLAQTRKITKGILSPPRLPFRHTGLPYSKQNDNIIIHFRAKIKIQNEIFSKRAERLVLLGHFRVY